jgi:2,4-didehydro-3-deoxy-L-rhamnonate hydrolase
MRLIRFGPAGDEFPGIVDATGARRDTSTFGEDWDERFFGTGGIHRLHTWLAVEGANLPIVADEVRWAAPIVRPSKIVCIGLNYRDHAREIIAPPPTEPILFSKATSSLVGPFDDLVLPPLSEKTDWEVELAVVIGERASLVAEADAMAHVAGYVLHNDYSERAFQLERGGQWFKGKSCDTFAPLGPWLATPDEVPDPQNLHLTLDVDGERMQDSSTAEMIFGVAHLVSYISQFMTLLPGDVISTGTPAGVGLGQKPPRYLTHGNVVELAIDGLGRSRQRAVAWERRAEQ